MKKYLVTLLVLVAFAATSSAIDFSNWHVLNIPGGGSAGTFIKKNPAGTEYIVDDGTAIDASTGNALIGAIPVKGVTRDVDWDSHKNMWGATSNGLVRVGPNDTSTYLTGDGMPSNYSWTIECDSAYNRLIVGTLNNGLSIVKQDASGKPLSYQNVFAGQGFHKVGTYGQEIWGVNTTKVYHYDGSNWITYDTGSSTISSPFGAFVAKNGNAYVGSDSQVNGYIAVYNHQAASWSKIIPDSGSTHGSTIPSLVVDNQNALWFTCAKYLVRIDLTTMKNERIPLDGSVVPCLNNTIMGSVDPVLGVTDDGNLLIAGYGAIVEVKSANAVLWHPTLAPKVARGSFQIIGQINPLGQLMKSFSPNSVSGMSFTLIRTAEGLKAVKTLIAR